MPSVKEFMDRMRDEITANPAKVAGLNAHYQFELTGADGGIYHASFDHRDSVLTTEIGEGPLANPSCVITLAAADFEPLMTGKLNPVTAFMTGKIQVKGDITQALKLQMLIS